MWNKPGASNGLEGGGCAGLFRCVQASFYGVPRSFWCSYSWGAVGEPIRETVRQFSVRGGKSSRVGVDVTNRLQSIKTALDPAIYFPDPAGQSSFQVRHD